MMDVKQEPFDPSMEIIKIKPDLVSDQMDENYYWCSTKDKTFKNDQDFVIGNMDNICEHQTREFVNFVGAKQECELPKIESSDFMENIEYESVRDNVNNFSNTIKKEPENANDIKAVDIGDIKPVISEISEYVQFTVKNESELLTSYCDLPTLKSEVEDNPNYFAQPCSSKKNLIKSKSSKHTVRNVPKQKKSDPGSVLQKIFRSPRKNLLNAPFGKCYDTCYYCGHSFLNKSQFLCHFFVFHYVKKVTIVCNQKFGRYKICRRNNFLQGLFRHPSTPKIFHSNKKLFRCEIYSKQFIEKGNLKGHLRIHTGEKPFKCEICFKHFTKKSSLNTHLKIHTGEKQFQCEICSKQFIKKGDLKRHLNIHTREKPSKKPKPLKCEICSKQFIKKCNLNYHLRIHTGEKPFKCEICSKLFIEKGNLKNHMRIHTGEKPFKCEICLKQFTHKGNLKMHLQIHNGEKSFECEICSKQFTHKTGLNYHLKIHTGEKQYQCEICSKRYFVKRDLNDHLYIHTGEKPFKCEICSKQFVRKYQFKVHLKTHTGEILFKCEICSKQFIQNNGLKKHLRIHTGEKPFKCEICLKKFTQKVHLKRHLQIHNEEKSFECEMCSKHFTQKSSLNHHFKIHTVKYV